jgi:hypothetical protein
VRGAEAAREIRVYEQVLAFVKSYDDGS